ncbi:MAG: hypothetical protein KGL16_09290 [Acidobacteriota bacterium]|nr:hypothetical protein [Acidobacteriota bacterium]
MKQYQIALELPSGRVELEAEEVIKLRDAAAAQAGHSSAARDLSLLLDRALVQRHPVALRRGELQTLLAVAEKAALTQSASKLRNQGAEAGHS